jgi:hypothetical protein
VSARLVGIGEELLLGEPAALRQRSPRGLAKAEFPHAKTE